MVEIRSVFCSYGGGDVVLWHEDSSKKFELNNYKRCKLFEKTDSIVNSLSWSFDNDYISAASKGADDVPLLSPKDMACSERLSSKSLFRESDGEEATVSCVCFLLASNQILVGSNSSVVALWDVDSKSRLRLFQGYSSPVSCLTRKAKDSLLVAGLEDGCITLHNMSSTSPKATLTVGPDHKENVKRVVFSPYEHGLLGSCGSSGAVRLWSVESQRLLTTFLPPHTKGASDVAFSPYNRKLVASVGRDMQIRLYDVQQRKLLTQIPSTVGLCSLLLMKDGVTMIAGGMDGNLYFYNLKNCKKPEYVINGHKGHPVTVMALQNVIKGNRSHRKLPSSKREKKTLTSFRGGEDPSPSPVFRDSLFQTPSPTIGTTPLIGSTLLGSETPLPSSGLSAIFSPLDAPSSLIPKSLSNAKDPPNITATSIASESKKTITDFTQTNEPLLVASSLPSHVPYSNGQTQAESPDITAEVLYTSSSTGPLLTTPLSTTAQPLTTSMGIFSPLDSVTITCSSRTAPPSVTTTVSSVTVSHPPPPPPSTVSTKASSSASSSATTVSSKSPVPKRISPKSHTVVQGSSSSHPKRVSPTLLSSSNNSKSYSPQQESTLILKENPTGSVMESSTLLNSKFQSNLASPDVKSTPLSMTQVSGRPHHPAAPMDLPLPMSSSLSNPTRTMPTTPTDSATPSLTTALPAVHIQYLENLIRESQEETYSAVHRDIRNLSVSMLRQFSALQNQMVLALTAISEKVDKASTELEQLRHQVNHLTPRY